jgi:hypothetical protein
MLKVQDKFLIPMYLILIGILYFASMHDYMVGFLFDDGMYVLGSLGIALSQGYTLPFIETQPPVVSYPPLLSFLLSPVWHLDADFPKNLPLLLSVPIAFGLLGLGLCYVLFRKGFQLTRMQAWAGLILLSLNPGIWQHLTPIMSESVYLTCSLATLVYFMHLEKQQELLEWGNCLKLSILTLLSFYSRTFGLTLFLAILIHLLFIFKQKKATFFYGSFCLLGMLPWFLYTQQIQANHQFYQTKTYSDFILFPYIQSYFQHYALQVQSVGLGEFFLNNLSALWETLGKMWFPVQDIFPLELLSTLLSGFSFILFGFAFIKTFKAYPLAWTYILITCFACLMWYDTHQYYRFLMMVFPILLGLVMVYFCKIEGLKKSLSLIWIALLPSSLYWGYQSYFALQAEGHLGKTQWAQNGATYQQAFQWIKDNTTPQDKIYTRHFTMMPLYTHRASMAYNDIIPEFSQMSQTQQQHVLVKMEIEKFKLLNPQYLVTMEDTTLVKLFPNNFILKITQTNSPLKIYQVEQSE